MNKLANWCKQNRGIVLVDALVGVLILAIGLAALALLYTNGMGTMHKSDTREKAVQIAADRIEVLKALDGKYSSYSELESTVNSDLNDDEHKYVKTTTDTESFTVTAALGENLAGGLQGDAFIIPVTVEVKWNNPDAQSCKLITYIALKQS